MKKLIYIIPFILVIVLIDTKEQSVLIKEESVRFRVVANSNNEKDQEIKKEVAKNLETLITNIPSNDITESISYLNNNIDKIDKNVSNTLKSLQSNTPYKINLGYNYFPEKTYKGVTYKEGNYKSLVVTLGEGKGKNWWCVLYPPLCDLESDKLTDTEYKLYIKEILNKF